MESRLHESNTGALRQYAFDPRRDIGLSDAGWLVWTGGEPQLAGGLTRRSRLPDDFSRLSKRWSQGLGSVLSKTRARMEMKLLGARGLEGKKLSLIILNWKRPQVVSMLVDRYSRYAAIGDIVVWNNNHECPPDLSRHPGIKLVTCRHDAGLDARWAAALLADEERLLIHDDDLILSEAAVTLLGRQLLRNPNICHGIRGRKLSDHYNLSNVYGPVDVVLTTCMAHRPPIHGALL